MWLPHSCLTVLLAPARAYGIASHWQACSVYCSKVLGALSSQAFCPLGSVQACLCYTAVVPDAARRPGILLVCRCLCGQHHGGVSVWTLARFKGVCVFLSATLPERAADSATVALSGLPYFESNYCSVLRTDFSQLPQQTDYNTFSQSQSSKSQSPPESDPMKYIQVLKARPQGISTHMLPMPSNMHGRPSIMLVRETLARLPQP